LAYSSWSSTLAAAAAMRAMETEPSLASTASDTQPRPRASAERPSYCSLLKLSRLVVPAWAGQAEEGTALVVVASGLRRRRFYSPDGAVTLMRSLRYVSAGVAKLGYLYMGRLDFATPLLNLI
jgi:hypothetical protein